MRSARSGSSWPAITWPFATKDKFASYNGTAPIDAFPGEQARHRLSRAGNRRINHALHMMAVTQIRYPGTQGRLCYQRRRTEGKTPEQALRCLKRRLSDLVLPSARHRPAGQNRNVRITYDPAADAACIYLTGQRLAPGRTSIPADPPEGVQAFIVLHWKDDRLVGLEVLDASTRLHPDLLGEAEILS